MEKKQHGGAGRDQGRPNKFEGATEKILVLIPTAHKAEIKIKIAELLEQYRKKN